MTLRKSLNTLAAATLVAVGALSFPLSASAQEKPRYTAEDIAKAKPSGTIEFTGEQLRLIVGGSTGKGTLHYKGKSYPFTMKGGSVGGVGVTKINAVGDVYFLQKVEDFPGMYSAATIGAALGPGAGGSQFQNDKGVFVSVRSKTEGVALNLGLAAVQVTLAK